MTEDESIAACYDSVPDKLARRIERAAYFAHSGRHSDAAEQRRSAGYTMGEADTTGLGKEPLL